MMRLQLPLIKKKEEEGILDLEHSIKVICCKSTTM